jgi:thiol-disulfide isomerase/thioredoxin
MNAIHISDILQVGSMIICKKSTKLRLLLIYLFILTWWVFPSITVAQSGDEPEVCAVLFYSPTCFHCHYVITEVLTPMVGEYGDQLHIIGIDTTQSKGGQLYQAAIERYQIPQERQGVPTLIIGEVVLVGSAEIPEQFPALLKAGLSSGGIDWPNIPGLDEVIPVEATSETPSTTVSQPTATSASTLTPILTPLPTSTPLSLSSLPATVDSASPVYLAYFFDPTCLECARVSAELKQLQARYPNLVVRSFDMRYEAALNEVMCEKYGVPDEYRLMSPTIFIGQDYLTPDKITLARLQTLIENPATAKSPPPWDEVEVEQTAAEERIVERFKQFSILAVVGAGLLDGVNPCAFTTIIFFVSYLALIGRTGREILLVGAAFTLAVFLTYLGMGLGLAEAIRQIGSFTLIGRFIYGITAIFCLVLAVMSILDYIKIRQGQLNEIRLQLPRRLKQRIHQTIRTHSRMQGYIGAAFGAGVLVSLFELACTGQVYLPTIMFVTGVTELRLTAIVYLVLYNLMFVMPLLLVFLVTYLGTNSRRLTSLFQANAGAVKLFTAALFGVLGIWLGYMVLMV